MKEEGSGLGDDVMAISVLVRVGMSLYEMTNLLQFCQSIMLRFPLRQLSAQSNISSLQSRLSTPSVQMCPSASSFRMQLFTMQMLGSSDWQRARLSNRRKSTRYLITNNHNMINLIFYPKHQFIQDPPHFLWHKLPQSLLHVLVDFCYCGLCVKSYNILQWANNNKFEHFSNKNKMMYQNFKNTVGNYSFFYGHTIGDGCSCSVYKGFHQQTKQIVSIKVVPRVHISCQGQVEMANTEIKTLSLLANCPNILNFITSIRTKNNIYIITQLCCKGTLANMISKERKFQEAKAIGLLKQIINGYRSIHANNIIHRDIKPSNIFLTLEEQVRIGDFGFAIDALECLGSSTQNIGSPHYMPLEALLESKYSFKSDIWAIGMTFLEMLIGRVPWRSKTERDLRAEIQSFQLELFLPKQLSERAVAFLKKTLEKDVEKRMTPQQLFAYSFSKEEEKESPSFIVFETPQNEKSTLTSQLECPKIGNTLIRETSLKKKTENAEQVTQENSKNETPKPNKALKENILNAPNVKTKQAINKKGDHSLLDLKNKQPPKQNPAKSKNKNNSQTQRKILLEVQSQIYYFRFLFKLGKKMQETLKTNDSTIRELKQHLLFLVHQKILEVKHLRHLSFPDTTVHVFQETQEYRNIQQVLNQYEQRYSQYEQKLQISPEKGKSTLQTLMAYTFKVLYQNILKIQGQEEELRRKKDLIFILEDLLHLHKLYRLDEQANWKLFQEHSSISDILDHQQEEGMGAYWRNIKGRVRQLIEQ